MPARKRTVRTINVRIDKAVDKALATLQAIHGDRLTVSQIIRDAIIEKAQHDAREHNKTGT